VRKRTLQLLKVSTGSFTEGRIAGKLSGVMLKTGHRLNIMWRFKRRVRLRTNLLWCAGAPYNC
jgi:hypothetical protein